MRFSQGCIKLGLANAGAGIEAILAFINQIRMGRVIRWMPLQRLKWFSSIQSREVAARLGLPLAQACLKALDTRRKIPSTEAALGWRTRLSSSRCVTSKV